MLKENEAEDWHCPTSRLLVKLLQSIRCGACQKNGQILVERNRWPKLDRLKQNQLIFDRTAKAILKWVKGAELGFVLWEKQLKLSRLASLLTPWQGKAVKQFLSNLPVQNSMSNLVPHSWFGRGRCCDLNVKCPLWVYILEVWLPSNKLWECG